MRQTSVVICLLMAVLLCTAAWASTSAPPADTLKVDYFANANSGAPDGTQRLTNPGTSGGNVWAAIYVFDPRQEMSECCACLLTPDGLRTLSINKDLTSNPLTGPPLLSTGLIKIVSSSSSNPAKLAPVAAVRGWGTHIQDATFAETETAAQDATLSLSEEWRLNDGCSAIHLDGSGHGICSCGSGD
jgi:hypothetical protein